MTRWVTLGAVAAGIAAVFVLAPPDFGQSTNVLATGPMATVRAKIGSKVEVSVPIQLRQGYHVNSNTPSDEYLIPLRLTWEEDGVLKPELVRFPKPVMENYSFSPTPLSVFAENFEITTEFSVPASAAPGPAAMNGRLRYQACNDRECLAPKTLNVAVQLDIVR